MHAVNIYCNLITEDLSDLSINEDETEHDVQQANTESLLEEVLSDIRSTVSMKRW